MLGKTTRAANLRTGFFFFFHFCEKKKKKLEKGPSDGQRSLPHLVWRAVLIFFKHSLHIWAAVF